MKTAKTVIIIANVQRKADPNGGLVATTTRELWESERG